MRGDVLIEAGVIVYSVLFLATAAYSILSTGAAIFTHCLTAKHGYGQFKVRLRLSLLLVNLPFAAVVIVPGHLLWQHLENVTTFRFLNSTLQVALQVYGSALLLCQLAIWIFTSILFRSLYRGGQLVTKLPLNWLWRRMPSSLEIGPGGVKVNPRVAPSDSG